MHKEQDKMVIVIEPQKNWTKAAHTLDNYQVLADF